MKKRPIVIGLVGGPATGKGEIANLLQENGFVYYSLSDALRRRATALGLPHSRQVLTTIGNDLRAELGGDALAKEAKEMLDGSGHCKIVIESIRNPEEVKYLQKELGAFIIGVTMPTEKRFELMLKRDRAGDPTTWNEFLRLVDSEEGNQGKDTDVQISKCLELVNALLRNDRTAEDLRNKTMELLYAKGIELDCMPSFKERR